MSGEKEIHRDVVLGTCRDQGWHSVGVIVENVLTKINERLWTAAVESRWMNHAAGEVTVRLDCIASDDCVEDFIAALTERCALHGVPFRREERGLGDGPGTAGVPKDPVLGPPKESDVIWSRRISGTGYRIYTPSAVLSFQV